jgi:hypothetical protein
MATERSDTKLKERALEFYKEHNVTDALEKLLNVMFIDGPSDVYGYMSEYFDKLSKDVTISKFECSEALDGNGCPSLSLSLYCTIHGLEKLLCTYCYPLWNDLEGQPPSNTDVGNDNGEEEDKAIVNVKPSQSVMELNDILRGIEVKSQQEINQVTLKYGPPVHHPSVGAAITHTLAHAHSILTETPLFLSLSNNFNTTTSTQSFTLPLPLSPIILKGMGKLKIKGFYICPSPAVPFDRATNGIINVYNEVGRVLSAKQTGGLLTTLPNRCYTLSMDKPETALDVLRDAVTECGLELGTDLLIFIDIGGQSLYDEEKKKYEFATGQWKTGEELVAFYSNLTAVYPGLSGLIDPLHSKDLSNWVLLADQLSTKCLLIADSVPLNEPDSLSSQVQVVGMQSINKLLCDCFETANNYRGINFRPPKWNTNIPLAMNNIITDNKSLLDLSMDLMCSTHQSWTRDSLSFDVDLVSIII